MTPRIGGTTVAPREHSPFSGLGAVSLSWFTRRASLTCIPGEIYPPGDIRLVASQALVTFLPALLGDRLGRRGPRSIRWRLELVASSAGPGLKCFLPPAPTGMSRANGIVKIATCDLQTVA